MTTDFDALLVQRLDAHRDQLLASLTAVPPVLDETQVTNEYDLASPVDVEVRLGTGVKVRIERLRVSKRVFPTAKTAEDALPYFEAHGYGRPLTKAGKINQRENAAWIGLPDDLARRLLAPKEACTHRCTRGFNCGGCGCEGCGYSK